MQCIIQPRKLVEVPVKGLKIEKTIRLIYRRELSLSHAAKNFLDLIRKTFELELSA